MVRRDKVALMKILDEIEVISIMTEGYNYDAFVNDEKTKRAVCMTLINIGELVKSLTDKLRQDNPDIPWRPIAGLRDVAAHGYFRIRMDYVWEMLAKDIPDVRQKIKSILDKL
jgi:uncharacterized protein with HEPN domain